MTSLDFYRRIGCDTLQFGNYGLPEHLCAQSPAKAIWPECSEERSTEDDGTVAVRNRTPWGTLVSAERKGHPVRYAVETPAEMRILTNLWRHMRYEETPGHEESFGRVEAAIGETGVCLPTLGPSPVQELIENQMGMEHFYYLLQDHAREIEELLAVMHERRLSEYEILCRRTPAEAVIAVENTSSTLTSPAIYEKHSLPQIRDYASVAHRSAKKLVLHMCGKLRSLLPVIRRAGPDAYNALTPPTVGDTPLECALDLLGQDAVILGGILNGNVFQKPGVTKKEIWRALDELYTPRVRRAHMVLWLGADGLPTPLERFLWVQDWMDRNGAIG